MTATEAPTIRIVTGHQPNLLPSTRFWWKMAKSDVLDLRYQAQFTKGYIHRVKMRDMWFTLPLSPKPGQFDPCDVIHIDVDKARQAFRQTMHGRYAGSPFYKSRGLDLVEKFESIETDLMWELNYELLLYVRDVLGIKTPIQLGVPTIGGKAAGVLSSLRAYPDCDTYISGEGAKKYMGDTTVFDEAGIKVIWSSHAPVTNDSIVSILMDHSDPMEFVLREQ